jgi:AraC family transcriptional regulator, transcriptional activator of pobA
MAKRLPKKNDTPVYCLDTFSEKAKENAFYIETLKSHLKNHPFISKPHRHDFYLLLYITQGSGEHTIDFVTYPVVSNSFFLMTPGQVHSWKLSADADGFILFFTSEFYQLDKSEKHLLGFPFFQSLHSDAHLQFKKNAEPMVDIVIREMLRDYISSVSLNLQLFRSYLDIILLKLANHYPKRSNTVASSNSTHKLRKLGELIDKHYSEHKQPHVYASLMNLSASYLNNLCKQMLRKTLGDLIQERIVLEAKRFFAYSDLTISQVSDKLHFSEPSYFIRFFKKQTGVTPEQFREQINRAI